MNKNYEDRKQFELTLQTVSAEKAGLVVIKSPIDSDSL